jgi:hypothetical protein
MSESNEKPNKNQLSPFMGARRIKTDLKTSENIFLQSTSTSRSSSPILLRHRKVAANYESSKQNASSGNSANR